VLIPTAATVSSLTLVWCVVLRHVVYAVDRDVVIFPVALPIAVVVPSTEREYSAAIPMHRVLSIANHQQEHPPLIL